jgi:DNA-binding response OmpR family regulator
MATILVVDDDPDSLELIELALEPGNHRAVLCDRGELALDLALSEHVDAIVLDIMMPGMTGFEVLQALRGNVFTRGIPVLVLSALGDASDRVRGLREGARDYLVKPFDVDELLLRVDNLLAQRPRPGALLEGSLSCLHLADILHQVVESHASGLLEIRSGTAPGQITLSQGKVIAATHGALDGAEAVLAMLDADSGEFCLLGGGDDLPLPRPGREIALHEVLMEAAWLTDQLERLRGSIPAPGAVLGLTGNPLPPVPESLARARIPEVLEALDGVADMTIAGLASSVRAAPRRVTLAVAWLCHNASVAAAAAPAEALVSPEAVGEEPEVAATSDLDAAIDHVVSSACDRGFPSDVVHVLLAAQPEQWESLGSIFQRLPQADALLDAGVFVSRVQERGAETLRLVHSDGTLLVHVHVLFEMSVARAETMLPMCSAVALWVGAADSAPESALLIDRANRSPAAIKGVIVPSSETQRSEWGEALDKPDRWSLVSSAPDSLIEALQLF